MFHITKHVTGGILWAKPAPAILGLLALSVHDRLDVGENHLAPTPTAVYGSVLLMAAIAYYILQRTIIASQGANSLLAAAIGKDCKGKISPVLYFIAIPLAFVSVWISIGLYVFVALMWLVPDRRIERVLVKRDKE